LLTDGYTKHKARKRNLRQEKRKCINYNRPRKPTKTESLVTPQRRVTKGSLTSSITQRSGEGMNGSNSEVGWTDLVNGMKK